MMICKRILSMWLGVTIVLAAQSGSVSSAEMTVMSLQERMSQSDAVVIGTIEEVHQIDDGAGGQLPAPVEHWLATCRVERYIIGPKIHNPATEEEKAVSLIHIAFEQKMMQKPVLVKLVGGRKYLLFLKEISAQGERLYEMITPYHGAFEAGGDYFVHDEQSPEYPQAVKMSFEEIVQRAAPQYPASVDIRQQPNRELSKDELRMKERLIALSRGEGAVADLRVELMDGGMASALFYNIASGKIVSQEWVATGSLPKREERAVTDKEIRQLLRTLIEHQYWTFLGTQSIPDASGFMFRLHYKDLPSVEYRCDAHEYEPSAQLSAVRSVWLNFVSGASPQNPASSQPTEQVKATQPLTLTIQTAKEVYVHGEPINIEAIIKNSGNDTVKIYSPDYWGVSAITVINLKGVAMKPRGVKVKRVSFEPFLTIPPQSSVAYTFDNLMWFHCGDAWQFAADAGLPPDTYTIYVTVTNPRCAGARILSTSLAGVLTSNTITIEIGEKGR